MKLYEIEQAILDCVDAETGEIVDIEAFDCLNIERDIKINNIISLYKHFASDATAIKSEEQILSERRKQIEANAERVKSWLAKILNGEKFETTQNKISWRKSESVELLNESEISDTFKEEVLTIKIDKTAIKNVIKQGIIVAGAKLISKNNIQIK